MKVGRNEPCPCGSGTKYKRCCEGKPDQKEQNRSRGLAVLLVLLIVGAAAVILIGLRTNDGAQDAPSRVWSTEHGHFHDVG